jgi:hypothetical protein
MLLERASPVFAMRSTTHYPGDLVPNLETLNLRPYRFYDSGTFDPEYMWPT